MTDRSVYGKMKSEINIFPFPILKKTFLALAVAAAFFAVPMAYADDDEECCGEPPSEDECCCDGEWKPKGECE